MAGRHEPHLHMTIFSTWHFRIDVLAPSHMRRQAGVQVPQIRHSVRPSRWDWTETSLRATKVRGPPIRLMTGESFSKYCRATSITVKPPFALTAYGLKRHPRKDVEHSTGCAVHDADGFRPRHGVKYLVLLPQNIMGSACQPEI